MVFLQFLKNNFPNHTILWKVYWKDINVNNEIYPVMILYIICFQNFNWFALLSSDPNCWSQNLWSACRLEIKMCLSTPQGVAILKKMFVYVCFNWPPKGHSLLHWRRPVYISCNCKGFRGGAVVKNPHLPMQVNMTLDLTPGLEDPWRRAHNPF